MRVHFAPLRIGSQGGFIRVDWPNEAKFLGSDRVVVECLGEGGSAEQHLEVSTKALATCDLRLATLPPVQHSQRSTFFISECTPHENNNTETNS